MFHTFDVIFQEGELLPHPLVRGRHIFEFLSTLTRLPHSPLEAAHLGTVGLVKGIEGCHLNTHVSSFVLP